MSETFPMPNRLSLPALRVFNYSVLDRLDRPLEYRINHQLRARSAEMFYVPNPKDFEDYAPPVIHPFPYMVESTSFGFLGRLATPNYGELQATWDRLPLEQLAGMSFDAKVGNGINSWLAAQSRGKENKKTMKPLRDRILRSWAAIFTDLIKEHQAPYVHYYAKNAGNVEGFESLLKLVPTRDYMTVQVKAVAPTRAFNNAQHFYFVHRDKVNDVYDHLRTVYG